MKYCVGLDVSLKDTSVCIVDEARKVVKEGKVPLVSVREQFEFLESVVIQEWWPDSRRVTDVDGEVS